MVLKINGKDIQIVDCSDCSRASFCAGNISQVITLLQRLGVEDYNLFILKCKNFKKRESDIITL